MAKFVWYVVDLENGIVSGTNDTDLISSLKEVMDQGGTTFLFIHKDSGIYFDQDSEEGSDGEEITEIDPSDYDIDFKGEEEDDDTPDED